MIKMKKHEISTEQKIKQAAGELFMIKGFSATKSREIAEAAGTNLALLNYHFKSKENLFNIVMRERFIAFFGSIISIFDDRNTSLQEKFEAITDKYFEILAKSPDLPMFVFGEASKNPVSFAESLKGIDFIQNSYFTQQIKSENDSIQPENMLLNLLSLVVFPFVMQPVLKVLADQQEFDFQNILMERKKMIPLWMDSILTIRNASYEV